ncbi:MAG: NAD-dependent epimerase/dehydratase family protein, partial [Phycisphaerales bacterium]
MNASRRTFLQTAIAGSLAAAAGAASTQDKTDPEFADVKPAEKKLKILILGGTGFLGPHIVRRAVAHGHTMTLFNRGRSQPDLFPDLEKLRG